jgi:hypothetical protein
MTSLVLTFDSNFGASFTDSNSVTYNNTIYNTYAAVGFTTDSFGTTCPNVGNLISIDSASGTFLFPSYYFDGCTGLTSINLGGATISSLPRSTFGNCGSLTNIVWPQGLLVIGNTGDSNGGTFDNCPSLLNVTVPNTVTTIKKFSFQQTASATTDFICYTINSNVTTMPAPTDTLNAKITNFGTNARLYTDSATSAAHVYFAGKYPSAVLVVVSSTLLTLTLNTNRGASFSDAGTPGVTYTQIATNGTSYWTYEALGFVSADFGTFPYSSNLTAINAAMGTFLFPASYFSGCTNLTRINLSGATMTTIPQQCFASCSVLTQIAWPQGLLNIGTGSGAGSAFDNGPALLNITVPDSVTTIYEFAFQQSSFTAANYLSYRINSNVTTIEIPINNNISNYDAGHVILYTDSDTSAAYTYFGTNYSSVLREVLVAVPPAITTISPNSGNKDGGTTVTITGTSFTGATSVTFDGTNALSFTVQSDTEITCVTPAGSPGLVDVVVTTPDGIDTLVNGFTYDIICFKEGSKILTDTGYKLVQDLRSGDLVKTVSSGFKKIQHIGYSKMYNNVNEIRSKNKLYRCSTSEYPELTEDLVITGCHGILIKNFKDHTQIEKTQEVLGKIYITEEYYRLPACVDDRTKIFEEEGVHTIWHFSLENSDYYMNYGVYANGLLVETTSNRMMVELSGMTLV